MRCYTLLACAVLLGTSACSTTTNEDQDALTVLVQDNSFSPTAKSVTVGQTVTWKWTGSNAHSVTFSGGPDSETKTSGNYTRTFSAAGTYNYTCIVHGSAMSGSVTVTAAASGITGSSN